MLKRASCPACGSMLTLPDDAAAGDRIEHCGETFRLLHAYGVFALEREE